MAGFELGLDFSDKSQDTTVTTTTKTHNINMADIVNIGSGSAQAAAALTAPMILTIFGLLALLLGGIYIAVRK